MFDELSSVPSATFGDTTALSRPLCVDLDGTLTTTDTLWESVVLLLRQRPWLVLLAPFWLMGGRARVKRAIAERVRLDPTTLPYRKDLLEALRVSRERGRVLVLATAADQRIAESVARHLGLFDAVHASDGDSNLKAAAKRDRLRAAYGERGFDYVGDSVDDEVVLEAAVRGYLVGASRRTAATIRRLQKVTILSHRPSLIRALITELRPHQWAKNALVILPVFLASNAPSARVLWQAFLAMTTFCMCASAGYVLNDLLDIEADRAHPTKRTRPFASGALPVIAGPPLLAGLLALAFGLAFALLPNKFVAMLTIYFVGTLSYSLYLKRQLLLDVLLLAGLYTHRIISGGAATGVPLSAWLLGFSMFLFTSLAFAKRYIELRGHTGDETVKNRGYLRVDLEMVRVLGTTSGYIAALVFMLYVESSAVRIIYQEPVLLWLILPVLLYWLGRTWLLAGRGQVQDDPVKFAVKDRHSLACAAVIVCVVALARFTPAWLLDLLQ